MRLSFTDGQSLAVSTYHDFRACAFGFPSVISVADPHRPTFGEEGSEKCPRSRQNLSALTPSGLGRTRW